MTTKVSTETTVNGWPRRARLELMTQAELAIRDAIRAVEEMPADEGLTEAVTLLMRAQSAVADFVDRAHASAR